MLLCIHRSQLSDRQNKEKMKNIIYLKNHQHKLIEIDAQAKAKAMFKKINERWLIEGKEQRDLCLKLVIESLQNLAKNENN